MKSEPESRKVSRRAFSLSLAALPLAAVIPQTADAQEPAAPSAPAEKKRADIPGEAPFAVTPFNFKRNDLPLRVQPFPMTEVRLQPGPFKQASDWNRGYITRLPVDRLLYNFRVNAGLPSSAKPLGGWEEPKCELRGHFVGHYMSACALLYASSGDVAIKSKGDELVAGMAECQAKLGDSGYLSAFPIEFFDRLDQRKDVWAPFYTIHKIMAGLLDMYQHAGNQQALDVVTKMAAWADTWTAAKTPEHMQEILNPEFGGMAEVLYNIAAVTNNDRWVVAGDRFTKKWFVTPLALRRDELRGLHANTHIPQVIGAARRYEISQDVRFHNVADFFWETVVTSRTYVTGGSSNAEFWRTPPNNLAMEMKSSSEHQECCCSYNMLKLTRHLYAWTGNAKYIDYYERNLLNHRLGSTEPETGRSTYFLSLAPGAWKTIGTEDDTFWCCTATAVEEFAKLNDTIYFHDNDGVYVNLFIASDLDWKEKGIQLSQHTEFPVTPSTTIVVNETKLAPWTMHLRIPSWTTSDVAIRINGKKLEGTPAGGSYFSLTRSWKKGDRVEMDLPMKITVEYPADDPSLKAFLYGPLVLAGQFPEVGLSDDLLHKNHGPDLTKSPMDIPALTLRGADPSLWIKPKPNAALTFETVNQPNITLRPLNQTWERYAVYWKTV